MFIIFEHERQNIIPFGFYDVQYGNVDRRV